MVKERSVNPAQAQRKLEKQKALKKGKAEAQSRRNEKLARRNPERLQRQIDDLRAAEASGVPLSTRDKQVLEELERDVRAVRKAREALGEKAPQFSGGRGGGGGGGGGGQQRGGREGRGRGGSALGKRRRRDDEDGASSGSETDEDVRRIPMPRDTPPPLPPQPRRGAAHAQNANANLTPLGEGREGRGGPHHRDTPHVLPPKPVPVAQTVYEAKPVVRDLRKEAVSKFVPAVVARKLGQKKGEGRLLEPEEMERLEKEGYGGGGVDIDRTASSSPSAAAAAAAASNPSPHDSAPTPSAIIAAPPVDTTSTSSQNPRSLEEEQAAFERELRSVQIEEVEDEDL
ncbi:MAG: hypothetical protein M1819_004142 [Sarea resinae]|nr:MAG: hypothetical protein M1819_004142 [Sarea resinae]